MKMRYNLPVFLTYTLLSAMVMLVSDVTGGAVGQGYFAVYPTMDFISPLSYWRLISHIAGHRDWMHLLGNFSFILLIGPILEEKYGSWKLLQMILITAIITAILNILLFSTGLMGASGIVFMFIILSSFTNFRSGDVPLTFILIILLFLTKEVQGALKSDNISQFAHILGGIIGSAFGFRYHK
ncbi:MAG: rhomboid family intramembrane serine protease [Fibrobacteria bacterium]|nr:rhomboid family intramembrane serine protease [Fibrobacteria bacterium]